MQIRLRLEYVQRTATAKLRAQILPLCRDDSKKQITDEGLCHNV